MGTYDGGQRVLDRAAQHLMSGRMLSGVAVAALSQAHPAVVALFAELYAGTQATVPGQPSCSAPAPVGFRLAPNATKGAVAMAAVPPTEVDTVAAGPQPVANQLPAHVARACLQPPRCRRTA